MSHLHTYQILAKSHERAAQECRNLGLANKQAWNERMAARYCHDIDALIELADGGSPNPSSSQQAGDGSSLPSPAPQIADAQHSQQVTETSLPLVGDLHKLNEVM